MAAPAKKRTTVLLCRHGDRHDYSDKPAWRARCEEHGLEPSDPPLSSLGHAQAREAAAVLAEAAPSIILCSPYLRTLQTAQPLAHATGLPLCVENALAEFAHVPRRIALPQARVASFPEVDERYEPVLRECSTDAMGREPTVEYMRRQLLLVRELGRRHAGETIVCFSHAASLALVGALTGCASLRAARAEFSFAPCGIWKLCSDDGGATWSVHGSGADNSAHITRNAATTFPWGFHSGGARFETECEQAWVRARELGPTTSPAAAPGEAGNEAARPKAPAHALAGVRWRGWRQLGGQRAVALVFGWLLGLATHRLAPRLLSSGTRGRK